MFRGLAAFLLSMVLFGCAAGPAARPASEDTSRMFAPAAMRIHPIFTQVKDWTGDGRPDGIEALVEFTDQFGDPTKASGTVIFELFSYRSYNPDPRGERLANPWIGHIEDVSEQRLRWNRTSRTYTFELEFPQVRTDRQYVLTATFDTGASRFFDRIIIERQRKEPDRATPATTRAVTTTPARP